MVHCNLNKILIGFWTAVVVVALSCQGKIHSGADPIFKSLVIFKPCQISQTTNKSVSYISQWGGCYYLPIY